MPSSLVGNPSSFLDALLAWVENNTRLFAVLYALLGARLVVYYLIPPSVMHRVVWRRATTELLVEAAIATVVTVAIAFATGPVVVRLVLLAVWTLLEVLEIGRLARGASREKPQPGVPAQEGPAVFRRKGPPDRWIQFIAAAGVSVMVATELFGLPGWLFLSSALMGLIALLIDFDRYGFRKRPEPWS